MEPAISVSHLSKQYTRGASGSYIALRDVLSSAFRKKVRKEAKRFWALDDVSFEIQKGERIGIIGRNGAGKSTLLKIISRITPPTKGKVVLEGRVASLLEVGTGFHPELTGRENIFLNGAILGLTKSEIQVKLDEIIDFSGVESFIDTPLKHYGSGMQLRLAFSVAAHLEPEILLIDEVLAVGDLEFQQKCLGKMEEVSKTEGRTILFVSHNLEAVLKFCQRSIWLEKGRLKMDDQTDKVVEAYVGQTTSSGVMVSWQEETAPSDGNVTLLQVFAHDRSQDVKSSFAITEPVGITFTYKVINSGLRFTHGINVFNEKGINIFDSHDNYSEIRMETREPGTYSATVWIPENLLTDGYFSISVALFLQQPFHVFIHEHDVIRFLVLDDLSGEAARGTYAGDYGGLARPKLQWQAKQISNNHGT